MPDLVGYLLLFLVIGIAFILVHLLAGKLVRPSRPDPEKMTIYECGEPTIGSAWIQFDLRFYVVALLFVIFDVEVAFFFPWAVVFGKANMLANPDLPAAQRQQVAEELLPRQRVEENPSPSAVQEQAKAAHQLAWFALLDILIFFGVLLVGFAYLWKRGDLNWVRSTAAERVGGEALAELPPTAPTEALVGAGRSSTF
jgi:NADH-quinone oxidoreductase subunit A